MHTGGVYSKNPPGFRYDPPARAKRFLPDVDGNWPAGIPGTPGANEYIRPQGYWVNDSDWEEKFEVNMSNDSILQDPTNTDGFIDAQSGTVKTQLPPNSRDFILGPLIDGYTYNHGYDDFTMIGYIQKDTRQIVALGQISGYWDTTSTLPGGGTAYRQWDGTASQFTAYNPSFTLEMVQWFKDKLTANNFTKNFPYFYSGGIPQSPLNPQPPGSPGNMPGGNVPGTGGGGNDPDDDGGGFGSGGEPDTGTEQPQDDPEGGDAESQGYPWGMDPEELDRMSDDDLAENDPPLIRDPETGDIREMTEDEKNQHDAEVLGLSPDEWAKIAEVFDASMLALDVVAVLGVIFPEFATSAAGAFQLARRANQIRRAWQIWSNRNKGGPSNKPKPPKPKTPKPDPNPNGDVPNSDRRGKDFNVDKDTGVVRNDKGEPTFEPTFDKDGNIKSYKPVDPQNIDRGRSSPSSGGDNPNTGHPEFNPGGKYNTRPPIKPKGGNTGGGGGSQPPRGGGNTGGGGGSQPPRGGGRPPRGGGGRPPRGGSSQPKFTGFDGKPLDPVDPSTIRRPDGKPFDPLPPKGGDSGKNTGKPPKGGFREWWNKGRNERIKNENEAPFGDIGDYFRKDSDVNPNTLFGDDALQRGKSDTNFKKGKQGNILGRPDQAFNPFRPAEKGGPTSGPTPAVRQAVERPLRKLKGGLGGAAKRAGGTDNVLGKQLTQQQQKDIVRKTRVLEDRVVNNLKSEKEIDGFVSKTEKAAEFIQKNEEASNVLDTAIKGARTAREVADQIGQYVNTIKVAGTAFGKFLAHNAGVMKATPENPVKINLPKQDAQNVSNTINKYLKDNKVPVAQWSNLPQKHLDGINSLVASGQQTNRSTINNKFRGEGGILRDEYHNTVNNIGRKDAFANHIRIDSKGIPYVSGIDDNYTFTDPQDALGGIPAKLVEITNKSPFTRNREDSPYTYKNSDGTSVSIGNMPSRWNLPAPTGAIVKSSPRARTRGSGFDNQKEPLPTGAIVPKTSGARALRNNYEPRGTLLREDKKRILREITKPLTEIKELPKTQKLEKYRPNFAGKYKPQNTPNVTASEKSDEMVKAKNAAGQTWRTKDKYWGGYQSQERMNVVYDNVGHGDQYFDRIVNENLHKKNLKNRQVQEHLNIIVHEKAMRQLDSTFVSPFRNIEEQETYDNKVKDPLFSKVADRLNKEINYEKKPAKKGYPDKPPVQLDPNTGMHPKYGKRYKYDKLDPQSAEAMPVQGNPEIDANVQKALDKRAKDRKIKNLTVNTTNEKVDWRETLQKRNVGESKKNFKNLRKDLQEQLYTNITTGMKVGQTLRHIPSGQTFTTGGALGGTETLPSAFSIFGDPTPAPDVTDVSFYPLQGYAKPMDMMRRKNRENLEDINARLDASQEFAKRVNSDVMMGSRVQLQDIIGDDRVPDEMKDAVKKYKSEMEVYDKKAAQRVKVLNNRIQSNISSVSKFVGKYGVKLGKSYPMGSSRLVIAQGGSKLVVISHSGFNYDDSKEFSVRVYNAKIDPETGKQLKISKEMGNFGRMDGDGIAQNPFRKPLKNQETIGRIINLGDQIEDKTFSIKDIPPIPMPEPPKNLILTPPQMGGDSVVVPSEDSNAGVGRTETKWALKNGLDPTKDKPSYSNFTYSQIDDSNDLRNAVMDEFSKRMLAAKNNQQAQLKIGKEQMEWERQFKKMMESKPPSNDKNFFSKMFNNIANYGAKLTGNVVSKTVFDTYMNKLDTKTLTSKPENITKLLKNDSQGRIEYSNLQTMVDGVMADVTLPSDIAREAALNTEYAKLRTGLSNVKNIVGQLDNSKNDGFKIVRNNNGVVTGIKLNKAFDFTGGTDTGGADVKSGAPAMAYASMKGLHKYFKSADFKTNSRGKIVKGKKVESPTMNVQLDFGIHPSVNKKKKNKLGREIK